MYTNTEHKPKNDKPCDGFRYDVFHKNSSADSSLGSFLGHELFGMKKELRADLGHAKYENRKDQNGSGIHGQENEKKRGSGKRCGGKLYNLYHGPEAVKTDSSHKTRKNHQHVDEKATLDSYVEKSRREGNNGIGYDASGNLEGHNTNYNTHADMFSVEQMLAYTLANASISKVYSNTKTFSKSIETHYSRIEKELMQKGANDVAYALAEEVERKYSKAYNPDEKPKTYNGRQMNARNQAKKAKKLGSAAKAETEKALKNDDEIGRKGIKGYKKPNKAKTKHETNRRSLPSGPKAVRKGHGRSSPKGSKGRALLIDPEQPESGKHKEKHRNSRKI